MVLLETTLSTQFIPSSNVKGDVAGANWTYLLPDLKLKRVLCTGLPMQGTLKTLTQLSQEVIVLCKGPHQVRELYKIYGKDNVGSVYPIIINNKQKKLPLLTGIIDLVLFDKDWSASWSGEVRDLPPDILRILKPDGSIYSDVGDLSKRFSDNGNERNAPTRASFSRQVFWLTPLHGEMQTAVLRHDRKTINYLVHHNLISTTSSIRLLARAEKYIIKHRWSETFIKRTGVLLSQATSDQSSRPPRYICAAAEAIGIDLDQSRWALLARGEYSSRKVLFLIFDREETIPKYIFKLTRNPTLNFRLENEYRALNMLWDKGMGDIERLPKAILCSHTGDLMFMGETIIPGSPFLYQREKPSENPLGRDACAWLSKLGKVTLDPTIASPKQVANGLSQLFSRFLEIYNLTSRQRSFIESQIESIAQIRGEFPLIFQHGDPGTWNMLVSTSGKVAFLDWEAAEPNGIPLWDLFYFLRSYCIGVMRSSGRRDSLQIFAQCFLDETSLNLFISEMTHSYCQQLGLSEKLIQPLFYTCWMHRALKESTRLPQAKLNQGHYVNLLRTAINRVNAAGLGRLFDVGKY